MEPQPPGCKKKVKTLEVNPQGLLSHWQPEQFKNSSRVKSIGKRAAALLIVFTQGFKPTCSPRQRINFAGLSPTEYSSGTSIQGTPRICKRGGTPLRDVLYTCAMNAVKTNPACKALYERLRAKGKTGKPALIAVCNRLLKPVFAVMKSGTLYQPK